MGRKAKAIKLNKEDREDLKTYISVGKRSARALKRALILKYADEGLSSKDIMALLDTTIPTIWKVKKRYLEGGLQTALCEKPRPGQPVKIGQRQEAYITTIACSKPPEGRDRWTIRMIADKAIELGYMEQVSRESVRQVLKKAISSHG